MNWGRELRRVTWIARDAAEQLRMVATLFGLFRQVETLRLATDRAEQQQWKMCPACDAQWMPVAVTTLEDSVPTPTSSTPDGQALCVCGLTYAQHRCGLFREAP